MKLPVEAILTIIPTESHDTIRAAFTTRGTTQADKNVGWCILRTNKPFRKVETFAQGCANFVWRWIAFDCSGSGKNACMPVTDDFELYDALDCLYGKAGREDRAERGELVRELRAELMNLQKQFMSVIPVELQAGVMRWGRALGMIG